MKQLVLFTFFTLGLSAALASAQESGTRLRDNSDWWSTIRTDSYGVDVKPGAEEISDSNLQISGIRLGPRQFEDAEKKLGKTLQIERGDASTGRHQICYRSDDPSPSYLIFEFGEIEENFYLFHDSPDWRGSEYCARTVVPPVKWATRSGLRLGLTRARVESILGKPDAVDKNRIIYYRETTKHTTPSEFAQLRKDYPQQLSDEKAHKMFDAYDVQTFIDIRFTDSKLTYLAVSSTESN
jgi:hypothetical protein